MLINAIVISADFSEPGGPILAGPSEDTLRPTPMQVGAGPGARLAAVKQLGRGYKKALVIDHHFDDGKGWSTRRSKFKRTS